MRLLFMIPLLTLGCKKPFVEVNGNVDGHSLKAQSAYWGGPYLVITDAEIDCMDMAWVINEYDDSDSNANDVATEENFTALQFTYESSTIEDGKLSIAVNDSPALAWLLLVENEQAEAYQATGGFIDLEIVKKDRAKGKFDLDFGDDGSLKGNFLIENCNNLKKRKND